MNIYIIALISQVVLTLVPIAIKITQANIYTIGFVRLVIAVIFLSASSSTNFTQNIKKVWALGPLFTIHWLSYAQAVKVSSPSVAVIGLSFYGFFLLIYSKLFLHQKVSISIFASVVFAFIGAKLIAGEIEMSNQTLLGLLWGVVSASAYGLLPIIHQKNRSIPANEKAFAQFSLSLLLYTILFFNFSNVEDLNLKDFYALMFLGIGGTVIGHGLWVKVTSELPTQITSGIYYLVIPLSLIFEILFLDYRLNPNHYIGSVLVLASNLALHIIYHRQKV